ncbi:6496_t:CDS:2 [Cetraspora pellucida]|uniref:6496_t:CDS:1 n=1 Tax=Cetraspora pellucida TaxID=1433469 RepID=A0A9N9CSB4_9GLOM|nr:6496_t:CDS:2 [Cetraspora pellucida]
MTTYESNNLEHAILPNLSHGVHEIVCITYDETLFYTNDELSIYVSDFICESIGCLKLSEHDHHINSLLPDDSCLKLKHTKACITIYPGSNQDALFMFDNSSNHSAFANNALLVLRINIKDGTKMPLLHNGIKLDGLIKRYNACKKNKSDSKNPKCYAIYILSAQSDFASQKPHIQEIIEAAGYICNYTFKDLKKAVSKALDSVNLIKIHCFAHHSECFMSVYKLELSRKAAAFAVKKYYSHC